MIALLTSALALAGPTLYDVVPDELPPSRTRCSIASGETGDYHEMEWDPLTSAQVVHRFALTAGASYRLSCVGELLPAVKSPIGGPRVAHATRWFGGDEFTAPTAAGAVATATIENAGIQDCANAGTPEAPVITCKPRSVEVRIHRVQSVPPASSLVAAVGPRPSGAKGSRIVDGERFLAGGAVLLDRVLELAAEVVVAEVRSAGMEGVRRELSRSLGCDASPPDLSYTCSALEEASLEQLLSDNQVLVRALLLDLASRLEREGDPKISPLLVAGVAAAVLGRSSDTSFAQLVGQLGAATGAVGAVAGCQGVKCSDRTIEVLAGSAAGAALVPLVQQVLFPADGTTPTERIQAAIALARATDSNPGGGALYDALDAIARRDLAGAVQAAVQLLPNDPQLRAVLGLAVALGGVARAGVEAATLSDEEWDERAAQYKQALRAWLRGRRSREDRSQGTILAGVAGSLGLEAYINETKKARLHQDLSLPVEVGLDWFIADGQSLRLAFSPLDLGTYASELIDLADRSDGAEAPSLQDRLSRAQRLAVSIGYVFRAGRVPPSVSLVGAWRPDDQEWSLGLRMGFVVPFVDGRLRAPAQ